MAAFEFLYELNRELSTAVPPSHPARYTLSQLLSDACRELGFRGIAYSSSVSAGTNYCFFHPSDFAYIDGTHELVFVTKVDYDFDAVARTIHNIENVPEF